MIKAVTSLKGQCQVCGRRADWRVVVTNDGLNPKHFVTSGTRYEFFCEDHLPCDVESYMEN